MKKSRYSYLNLPDNPDMIDVVDDFNTGVDAIDKRLGLSTQPWQDYASQITLQNWSASSSTVLVKRFNKTVFMHMFFVLSVNNFSDMLIILPSSISITGETNYEGKDSPYLDVIGYGLATDISTGLGYQITVHPSDFLTNRIVFQYGSPLDSSTPFAWAAGDLLTANLQFQTGSPI